MTPIERIKWRLDYCTTLLEKKGEEYHRNGDFFHNFTLAAKMNNETRPEALHGMLSKHLVSYIDMLEDIKFGKNIDQNYLTEKFGDIITYFLIQEVLIEEDFCKPPF